MSDLSMMIRKQEKKLTEILMKKTHFSFGEIGMVDMTYMWMGDISHVGMGDSSRRSS